MSEEPEEVQPQQRRTVSTTDDAACDQVVHRDKEAGAEVAVAKKQQRGGKQNTEAQQRQDRSDEPRPDGQGHAVKRHSLAAFADDGRQNNYPAERTSAAKQTESEQP